VKKEMNTNTLVAAGAILIVLTGGFAFQQGLFTQEDKADDLVDNPDRNTGEASNGSGEDLSISNSSLDVYYPEDGKEIQGYATRVRFAAEGPGGASYRISVDGEAKREGGLKSGQMSENIIFQEKGSHDIEIALLENSKTLISKNRTVKTSRDAPKVSIELSSPEGEVKNGESIRFVYSLDGDTSYDYIHRIDGEKIREASGESKTLVNTTYDGFSEGEHNWSVSIIPEGTESALEVKKSSFSVENRLSIANIRSVTAENTEAGWQTLFEVKAFEEVQYETYLDEEKIDEGHIPEGVSNLGSSLDVSSGTHTTYVVLKSDGQTVRSEEVEFEVG
jgi:hypothetical protein